MPLLFQSFSAFAAALLTELPRHFDFLSSSFIGIVYVVGASYWTALSVYSIWCMKDVSPCSGDPQFISIKPAFPLRWQDLIFLPQAYLFFRGKGGIQQAKQDAALAAFKAGVQQSARQPV